MADQFGEPLTLYSRSEEDWPHLWRLPEQDDDAAPDVFDKMAWLADDVLLREAIHCWDNCMRLPGAFEGVQGGMLSAHARLVVGYGPNPDLEKAAEAVAQAWLGMAKQWAHINANGWDAGVLPQGDA